MTGDELHKAIDKDALIGKSEGVRSPGSPLQD